MSKTVALVLSYREGLLWLCHIENGNFGTIKSRTVRSHFFMSRITRLSLYWDHRNLVPNKDNIFWDLWHQAPYSPSWILNRPWCHLRRQQVHTPWHPLVGCHFYCLKNRKIQAQGIILTWSTKYYRYIFFSCLRAPSGMKSKMKGTGIYRKLHFSLISLLIKLTEISQDKT